MTNRQQPRAPRAFSPDDPAVEAATPPKRDNLDVALNHRPRERGRDQSSAAGIAAAQGKDSSDQPTGSAETTALYRPNNRSIKRRLGWGAVLLSAIGSLSLLAAGAWVMSFVADVLEKDNLLGWLAFGLLGIAGLAALIIIIREFSGLMRLRALHRFRDDVKSALASREPRKERKCLRQLKALYRGRSDMTWALAGLAEHEKDIRDPGDLLALAERDLIVPLDDQAKLQIVKSAKKISVATAISPAAILDVLFVLAENLSLLRRLATLYGARPGLIGSLKLGRMVVTHIIATGGLALTDDLFGQFLGQDLVRRMSRRLGEGMFNGALTARIGIAAIEVLRPLPFIEQNPVRLRELVPLIFKKSNEVNADDMRADAP